MTSEKLITGCFCLLSLCVATSGEGTNFTPQTAAAHLKLVPPVVVEMAGSYTDGGSIGITLVDTLTNKFHMFEDHSLANGMAGKTDLPEDIRPLYVNASNTVGRIYIAQDRPSRGGRLTSLDEGRLVKQAVICLGVAWFDREFPAPEQMELQPRKQGEDSADFYRRAMRFQNAQFILTNYKKKGKTDGAAPN